MLLPVVHPLCPSSVAVPPTAVLPYPPLPCRAALAVDLRREFTAVIAEAQAKARSSGGGGSGRGSGRAAADTSRAAAAAAGGSDSSSDSMLPLLSLTTTQLSFSTLTRVLFRVAFKYK